MKKAITIFLVIYAVSIFAQIPNTINWQGVLQDAQGNLLNGTYSLTAKFFEQETGGTALWTETHQNVVIEDGFIILTLGSITPMNISFDKQYWFEITIGNGEPLSRIKLSSAPYSLFAQKTSNTIIGDSLVLKDSLGVTRFVINPNNGTFKIMNKDTVWYSIAVNSPPVTNNAYIKMYNDSRGSVTEYYKTNSTLNSNPYKVSTNLVYNYSNSNEGLSQTKTTIYNENGQPLSFNETVIPTSGGEPRYINSIIYDENGNIAQESTKDVTKYLDGSETITTIEKVNGITINHKIQTRSTDGVLINRTINYNNTGQPTDTLVEVVREQNEISRTVMQSNNIFGFQQTHTGSGVKFGPYYDTPGAQTFEIENASGLGFVTGFKANSTYGANIEYWSTDLNLKPGNGGSTIIESDANVLGSSYTNGNTITNGSTVVNGNSTVLGDLNVAGTKNFLIDYPDDPYNKYLVHAAIESDEVLNQYSGNIITDANGLATVNLPEYIQKININFRYQLTVIGEFAQAIILKKIENNTFIIKTDKPNIEVSWMITANRNDSVMKAKPFNPIREKEVEKKGSLIFGK